MEKRKHYQLWKNQGAHEGWSLTEFDTAKELLHALQAGGEIYGEEFLITEKLDLAIVGRPKT